MPTRTVVPDRTSAWLAMARAETGPIALALSTCALLLAFLGIARAVSRGETRAFDLAVLHALRPTGAPHHTLGWIWANIGARDFSAMGSIGVLTFIVVLVCGLFLGLGRRREAALLFFASAGGLIMTVGFQALFNRDRPPLTPEEAAGLNASFPSGHALLSATIYLTLGALIGHFAERRFIRLYALGAAAILTVIVGLSRVFLGMHWCTDVLAGWCVGVAWALIWRGVAIAWERVSHHKLSTGR